MWKPEMKEFHGGDTGERILSPSAQTGSFKLSGKSWFVSSETPSDFLVQVRDFAFHLHKFPLHSRSGWVSRTIQDARERDVKTVVLDDFPGGNEAFELVAKFCYGVEIDLTPGNISGLRCAAEYLEMTEDMEEGNLILKTESFLSYVVSSSWKDSILVLKTCDEKLSPWAESLQIVRRCSDSIAWKACSNTEGVKWEYTMKLPTSLSPMCHEISDAEFGRIRPYSVPSDWWFEDISVLRIDHFVRVVNAIKVKGMGFQLVGGVIMNYAGKWLPGLLKETDQNPSTDVSINPRMIIESLISIIPPQEDSVTCNFLLRLLRLANRHNVSQALVTDLEKRVGMQLEQATLEDLLIPSYNKSNTTYDIDLVQRLLEHFQVQVHMNDSRRNDYRTRYEDNINEMQRSSGCNSNGSRSGLSVARLVDGYLNEVSRDKNLSFTKFQVLAESLPENARICDDGLYRAIDSYLKAHLILTEHERKRICRVMDCEKLSMEACQHAAQNERLPLRVVVQILFHEQQKISKVIANKSLMEASGSQAQHPVEGLTQRVLAESSVQEGWDIAAKRDIRMLKFEVENVKAKCLELQHEMDSLQNQLEAKPKQNKRLSALSNGWKKLTTLSKGNNLRTPEDGNHTANPAAEQAKKTPRRWRNSIS